MGLKSREGLAVAYSEGIIFASLIVFAGHRYELDFDLFKLILVVLSVPIYWIFLNDTILKNRKKFSVSFTVATMGCWAIEVVLYKTLGWWIMPIGFLSFVSFWFLSAGLNKKIFPAQK